VFIDAAKKMVLNNEYVTPVSEYFKSNPFHANSFHCWVHSTGCQPYRAAV